MSADEQAVLAVHLGWLRANETGDVAWLREHLDPGYTMMNTNGSVYRGPEHLVALWEYYRGMYPGWRGAGAPLVVESVDPEVRVVGDAAWVAYRLIFAGESTGGEGQGDIAGTFRFETRGTDVLVRRDGRWRIAHGHYSFGSPGGPAGGE
ncbi:MAG: nuclear transport factor 2 family protein [Thermoleophilia bacterium]